MTKNIQAILTPFLTISYVFGLRIANLSTNHLKLWFSLSYILLIWLTFYFLSTYPLIYSINKSYSFEYYICYWLEMFTNLLSIVFYVYHDKKFQNCLKKFDIIDNTLLKLGTVTDYDKLHKKSLWLILGWFVVVISMNSMTAVHVKIQYDCDILTAMGAVFIRNYSFHLNAIGDLTTAVILGHIGLKFDQINNYLSYMVTNNVHEVKQVWENMMHSHHHRFSKTVNGKRIIWIIIHLHLELRKISCEIDSIFVTQMSIKMAWYFGWIVFDLQTFFYIVFVDNVTINRIIGVIENLLWFLHNVFKFFLINYVCQTVSIKASATGDLLNRLLYSTCDIETREVISQFSLHIIYTPLKFYGIGFFQFGFKYLRRFITYIVTVLVIIIQGQGNK